MPEDVHVSMLDGPPTSLDGRWYVEIAEREIHAGSRAELAAAMRLAAADIVAGAEWLEANR